MIFRGVTLDMVRETIASPDRTDSGYAGKRLAFKRYGSCLLKVVFKSERNHHIVVTMIWEEDPN